MAKSKCGRCGKCYNCSKMAKYRSDPEHREKMKAKKRAWCAANPSKQTAMVKDWKGRNPDYVPPGQSLEKKADTVLRERERQRIKYQNDPATRERVFSRNRTQALKRKGFSWELYGKLWSHQSGRCACCRKTLTSENLHVDHCHDTGTPRGLLCAGCNTLEVKRSDAGLKATERSEIYVKIPPAWLFPEAWEN